MDAITLLRTDHKALELLFKRFENAGEHAYAEKRQVVDRIIEELSIHAAVEEQVFYPVARAAVPGTEDMVLESLEEHHIVKWVLAELADLEPSHERFDAKVTVLVENVRHHVKEEETALFPKVRAGLGRKSLAELGDALATAKRAAPTRPHPRASDVPPNNALVGAIAGVVDRVGDNISGLAHGGLTAVQDLIDRIVGTHTTPSTPVMTPMKKARTTTTSRPKAAATKAAAGARSKRSAAARAGGSAR